MEAAIPISILTIGLARAYARRSTLLENVIVTGDRRRLGLARRGRDLHAARALHPEARSRTRCRPSSSAWPAAASARSSSSRCAATSCARRTASFPYPEATAITEVLVTGEKGGSQAKLLLQATGIAGVYDFLATTFQVWHEFVDFQFVPAVRALAERAKVVLSFDAVAFILGLGYVMGLRSSMILCAGGFLSNFVLVPAHLDDRPPPAGHGGLPGSDPDRADDGRADLPRLRALRRRRRDRHRRHLRHPEVAAHRRRLVLDRGPHVPPRRGRGPGAHRPRHPDRDDPRRRRSSRRSPPASSSRPSASRSSSSSSASA